MDVVSNDDDDDDAFADDDHDNDDDNDDDALDNNNNESATFGSWIGSELIWRKEIGKVKRRHCTVVQNEKKTRKI